MYERAVGSTVVAGKPSPLLQSASGTAVIGSLGAKAVIPAAADPGTRQWVFETGNYVSLSPTPI